MLFNDPKTWETLFVTFKFALISLPIGMISAFLLEVLLNSQHLIGKNIFRTLFYAPTMVPLIAAILIWSRVLNPQTGWLNQLIEVTGIEAVGINGLRWLDDPNLIYIAYTFIGLWGIGNAILINLVLSVVGLLQFFIVPWVLNLGSGYPEGTTNFYMIYFYKQAFTFQNMGYGATLAWFMFIIGLAITIFLFATGRYWVYYAGESK